ncbi:hypothetical protein ANRL4_01194 [Anaerolineae bacterium]|nr:hypothetical protein ANRL4_01194 [Anaerolineae bacterium]
MTQTLTKKTRPKRKRYFGMTAGQLATIAAMGAFICVVFGVAIALLLDNPSQASQVSQKVYPTAALPTDISEPARTPLTPTKQPDPVTSGLDVSTLKVKSVMENEGYVFESLDPVMGQERWLGSSSNGRGPLGVDLRGSPRLVGSQLFFVVPDDNELLQQIGHDMGLYIVTVLPNWSGGIKWIKDNAEDVMLKGREAHTTYDGVPIRFSLTYALDNNFVFVTIGDFP